MSRHTDVHRRMRTASPPLPPVDWSRIGAKPPTPIHTSYAGPEAKLPGADVVVVTWTDAEWSALDHVFLHSTSARSVYARSWRDDWRLWANEAPSGGFAPLWGRYRMVRVNGPGGAEHDVLLFKSDAHLAHPPWLSGLTEMLRLVFEQAEPHTVVSTGTAGGGSEADALGDAVVTNAAYLKLEKKENEGADYTDEVLRVEGDWFPAEGLFGEVAEKLLYPLSNVVTHASLEACVEKMHEKVPSSADFGLDDMMNAPVDPAKLRSARILPRKGVPLLTTDFYYIAQGKKDADWAFLEMDDAVILHAANRAGVRSSFIRNISDPVVRLKTPDGRTIPGEVRDGFSGQIYDAFGFYTTFNSALTVWAALAGSGA